MGLISTDNHAIRKALRLSGNECMVLVQVIRMSGKVKFPKMTMSKNELADRLDLSRSAVFTILDTLEDKGYILRTADGICPTEEIEVLDRSMTEEAMFFIQSGKFAIASGKQAIPKGATQKGGVVRVSEPSRVQNPDSDSPENGLPQSRKWTPTSPENGLPPYSNKGTENESASSSEKTDANGGGETNADQSEGTPQPPDIPNPPDPIPQVAPAPPSPTPRRGAHPAYVPLVEAQDAWLKGRGHAGVNMNGKEGKALKTLIPRIESQLRAEGDDPTPDNVVGYLKWIHSLHPYLPKYEQTGLLEFASLWAVLTKIVEHGNEATKRNPLLKRNMEIDDTLKYYAETQGDQTENIEAFAKAFGTTDNPETWKESYLAAQGRCLLKWPGFSPVDILRRKAEQYRADCQTKRLTQKGPKRWLDEDGWVVKYVQSEQGRVSK